MKAVKLFIRLSHLVSEYSPIVGILFVFVLLFTSSCKKFMEIDPPITQLASDNVFASDATAISAMVGTYNKIMSSTGFASGDRRSVTILCGLSSDELDSYSTNSDINSFYRNALTSTNIVNNTALWNEGFNIIYSSNAILEGLTAATGMSDSIKQELRGEAKFLRAFYDFYLVNLYGAVPLITSTDFHDNSIAYRVPVSLVYDSIIADLKSARILLADDYSYSNGERIRPNSWAATAMLARVYLYLKNWPEAEALSTSVILNSDMYSLVPDLNNVFIKNSDESIWQLMPVRPEYNTNEGQTFILTEMPEDVALSRNLLDAFESGDNRRTDWVDSIIVSGLVYYFPHKYKIKTGSTLSEYSMVLRLAEQYLIRAEARAELGDILGSAADINSIRLRAGLNATIAADKNDLLAAVQHERQIELNTEWGHRWLDLKRTGQSDNILQPVKAPGWHSTDTLYPIPQIDLSRDPNLTQNPGY
jgi:hypothetical protein